MAGTMNSVMIQVYDISGRLVRTLVNEPKNRGTHSVIWNGTDNRGRKVSGGVYIIKMNTVKGQKAIKVLLYR
ncbi:MAG: FlgD immunoglobulin-like domain containing protein, partial [Planctomycetota bacterium]|jgi:flagellar hook assembly protein FlgD